MNGSAWRNRSMMSAGSASILDEGLDDFLRFGGKVALIFTHPVVFL